MRKKISLTVDERVILHLMDFIPNEEDFEAPEGCTQAGIARGVGIERKHVPRAVKKLIADEIIESRVSHVRGGKQRKKVYFLTFEGKALARRIWENLAKKRVYIRDDTGKDAETTFSELCFTFQVNKSPVELLLSMEEGNVYNPHRTQHIESIPIGKKKKPAKSPSEMKDIYKKALKVAWEDSILTKDEAAMLKELRSSMGISEEEHLDLQEEIIGSGTSGQKDINKSDTFRRILEVALRDGTITDDEQEILDELERILGLDEELATKIKMEMKLLEGEGMLTSERRRENYREIYGSVIRESMKDGRISRDEQNIIILLKKLMDIGDSEHLEIFEEVNTDVD
jgi:DNA-binding MarR family transcriptional regulator